MRHISTKNCTEKAKNGNIVSTTNTFRDSLVYMGIDLMLFEDGWKTILFSFICDKQG